MKVTITAVIDVPETTAKTAESWIKGFVTELPGRIDGLTVESIRTTTEGHSEQAVRRQTKARIAVPLG